MDTKQCEVEFKTATTLERCTKRPRFVARLTEYSRKPKEYCVCSKCLAELKRQMGENSVVTRGLRQPAFVM